ncbi:MAG: hypothetical protein U0524_00095 [Candidatus Saccharimonadales bacterium]
METISREEVCIEDVATVPRDIGGIATESYVGISYAGEQPEPRYPNPEPTEMVSIPLPPIQAT